MFELELELDLEDAFSVGDQDTKNRTQHDRTEPQAQYMWT